MGPLAVEPMGKSKPGLFGRLKRAVSSQLTSAVDAVSDPGQELALMLDDLAAQIKKAELDLRNAVVQRKVLEKKLVERETESQEWQTKAEQALRLGDESLARAALERKTAVAERLADTQASLADQTRLVDTMQRDIETSKEKLQSLNMRRGTLMSQARASKQASVDASAGGATGRIDGIESKIAELEAINEVAEELAEDERKEADVNSRLAQLEGDSALDSELDALKEKLRSGNKSLTDGS